MQAIFIFLAIIIGILIPDGHHLTFLIRPNLMVMLFIAFLNVDFNLKVFRMDHLKVVLANFAIPLVGYYLVSQYDQTLALIVFVIGMAPTAAGAPVIATFLRNRVPFVTISVLLTNPFSAIVIPFLLPFLVVSETPIDVLDVLFPVLSVVFVPLTVSLFIKKWIPVWLPYLYRLKGLPFYLFLLNVYIASGKATDFIMNTKTADLQTILQILGVTIVLCLFQFPTHLKPPWR